MILIAAVQLRNLQQPRLHQLQNRGQLQNRSQLHDTRQGQQGGTKIGHKGHIQGQ